MKPGDAYYHPKVSARYALGRIIEGGEDDSTSVNAEGRRLTKTEARNHLIREIRNGLKYVPLGPCDHFDRETGCLGHDMAPIDEPFLRTPASGTPRPW